MRSIRIRTGLWLLALAATGCQTIYEEIPGGTGATGSASGGPVPVIVTPVATRRWLLGYADAGSAGTRAARRRTPTLHGWAADPPHPGRLRFNCPADHHPAA